MITLRAKIRKEKAKKTRKKGKIPGILYGPGIDNIKIEIDPKELNEILKKETETSHISLKIAEKEFSVLIKEIQRDPIKDRILHIDFFQPSVKEKIRVSVPLVLEGRSEVQKLGGVIIKNLSEIEVKGFWKDIPKEIKVDISKLKNFEDKILVSDLKLPKGIEILRGKEEVIAFATKPEKEEVEEEVKEKAEEEKETKEKEEKETKNSQPQ
jgi:large subunit ribosomal protein L25